jgi:hypothetical protein
MVREWRPKILFDEYVNSDEGLAANRSATDIDDGCGC